MAEDFQSAICGDHWWSSSRSMLLAVGGLSPCSVGVADLGCWPPADDFLDVKPPKFAAAATDSSSDHHNNLPFQDYSTFQMMGFALSSSTPNSADHWTNQSDDLLCGGGGGGESNFNYNEEIRKDWRPRNPTNSSSINELKEGNEKDYNNLMEQNGLNSMNCSSTTLYGYPSNLYHHDDHHQQQQLPHAHSALFNTAPSINTNSTFPTNDPNELSLSSAPNFSSNYLKPPQSQPVSAALHFTNNTPFWNASSSTDIPQGIASLLQCNNPKSQNLTTSLALKPAVNSAKCEEGHELPKKNDKSNATESPVFKRPRIETPSPLPTFKVRKEKLGDRVTALQQLVSPFGKTDTASVLHEAIEYIKFLHDQVSVLSTPYMKSNNGITPLQHQQVCEKKDPDIPKQDLKSRGLCLVPISSTFPVTNATTADFWTPTFGGSFR